MNRAISYSFARVHGEIRDITFTFTFITFNWLWTVQNLLLTQTHYNKCHLCTQASHVCACWTCPHCVAAARVNLSLTFTLFREAHSKVSQLWEHLVGRYSELDCPIVRNSLCLSVCRSALSPCTVSRVFSTSEMLSRWSSSPASYWILRFINVFVRALQVSQFSPNQTRRLNIILLRATEWSLVHITFSI
jgi:hypothetical protein